MTIWEAVIEGILQGATEFLPISSSGHLALSKHFLDISVDSLLFDVMMHIGTLVAVMIVYHETVGRLIMAFFRLIKQIFTGTFKWSQMDEDIRLLLMLIIGLLPLFLLFVPVPGTGMKIKDFADVWATDDDIILEGCALIVTSILLTLGVMATAKMKGIHQKKTGRSFFKVGDAICVGLTQFITAIFPGVSRSGSTLSMGLMRGVNRKTSLDYSFVIGIPSIIAAALLTVKESIEAQEQIELLPMLVGMLVACIVGFLAIKLLRWMVSSNKLGVFAWYTLILGIAVVVIGIVERSTGVNVATGAMLNF